MPLRILPYQPEHEAAVAAFNARGLVNRAPFSLSKTASSAWLPKRAGLVVCRELFLALDGGEVRGGFALRRQPFWVHGEVREVGNYQGPLSEGTWDRRYMMTGIQMLRAALREQPLLYALGMGGLSQPLPRLLVTAGWSIETVPFRFKVLNPPVFLREIRPLRQTPARARLLDFAAATGLGPLGIHAWQALHTRRRPHPRAGGEVVADYGHWADEIWARCKTTYALSAIRDRTAQNILFGDGNSKNITLRCSHAGRDLGWAVVRSTPMQDDQYFGNMQVGSLVDGLALPGEELTVVDLATRHLQQLGCDLVVSNQSHTSWLNALNRAGFMGGPSNFLLACSPALAELLGPLKTAFGAIHFNRADGDGPIHL